MHKIICARVLVFLLYHTSCVLLQFSFVIIWSLPLCIIVFDFQMSKSSLPYIGFVDGASRSTQNLSSVAWTCLEYLLSNPLGFVPLLDNP
jgi:hypothetical protein